MAECLVRSHDNLVRFKSLNNGYKLLVLIYWGSKSRLPTKTATLSLASSKNRRLCRTNVSTSVYEIIHI